MRIKKTQIIKGRSENGDTTSNFTEIKKIVRKYYGLLYADKLDSLDDMDKWLNTQTIKTDSKRNRKSNRTIISNEIESVIKNLLTKKTPGQDALLVNSTKHLKNSKFYSKSSKILKKGKHFSTQSIRPLLPWNTTQRHDRIYKKNSYNSMKNNLTKKWAKDLKFSRKDRSGKSSWKDGQYH